MSIRITADSPADIPAFMKSQYDIATVPLHIILGDSDFEDGITITPDDIYNYYQKTKNLPKTSAVSIMEYQAFFEETTKDGDSVIHFSLSSGISSTYRNAVLGSQEVENVYVIDTKSLTTGMALVMLKAVDMINSGMDVRTIVDNCNRLVEKTKTTFIISNLEFLYKGGRCSGVAAFGANVLGLKPSICMNSDGELLVDKKYRGKFSACISQYIKDLIDNYGDRIDTDRAIIVSTMGVTDEEIEAAKKEIEPLGFDEVIVTTAGCTITSHCGKGTFAFQFMLK